MQPQNSAQRVASKVDKAASGSCAAANGLLGPHLMSISHLLIKSPLVDFQLERNRVGHLS